MGKARTWQVLFCTFVKKLFGGFLRFRVKPADSPLNPPCFSVIPRPISPPNIAAEQTHAQHPSQRGQESRFEHRRDPMTDTTLPGEIRHFSAKKAGSRFRPSPTPRRSIQTYTLYVQKNDSEEAQHFCRFAIRAHQPPLAFGTLPASYALPPFRGKQTRGSTTRP